MPKARLVFDGDNVYIGKDARIYKIKDDIASKIDGIPGVVDSLDSTSATDALSANMGRTLQDQINSLSGTGKFLSTWNCTTGLPGTNPQEDPYTYKVGDYYVVSSTGSTNYKPHGGTYTQGVPSTTVELENVGVNDKYYFDGADWVRIPDTAIQIGIDQALSTTSTNAVENRAIATAVNGKQDIISDLSTIRAGAALGSTAIQPNDNISQLTNNIGYQTAGDVNSAIQSAIGQLPTVNDGVLTIQKNSTTIDTFSANSASNKTINIPVPTTVAELSDANNYATKTDLNNAIDSLVHEGSTAPQNPQEGDMWYDTVNHVLKIYNGTTWETVDTDTDTTYTAGNGINISAQHEISVDTSVVATKEYVDDKMSSGSTAPANPVEGQIWYDATNHILKIYNGTNRVPVDTNTTYTAGNNITINQNNEISAVDTTYTAGPGIEIRNGIDYSAMRGPCPEGFHIPSPSEWEAVKTMWTSLGGGGSDGTNFGIVLKLPFAGRRFYHDASKNDEDVAGYYWTSTAYDTDKGRYLEIDSSTINCQMVNIQSFGHSVRAFKDEPVAPDNTWTTIYTSDAFPASRNIKWSQSLGLITLSYDGTYITIADKNLGATTVRNSGDYLSHSNCGYIYQWGNNYGFLWQGNIITDNVKVDTTGYGPGNYYSGSAFITVSAGSWSSVRNDDLWGGATGIVTLHNAITNIAISDAAFSNSWDGDTTHAPSKNAVYDVLGDVETLLANL